MSEDFQTDKSALSLILYPYQFDSYISNNWTQEELSRLERILPLEKLVLIDQHIENYFKRKDVDLLKVMPSIEKTIAEKEAILLHVSKGIKLLIEKKAN